MADTVVVTKGGKPLYITDDIEEWTGFNPDEAAAMPPALVSPHLAVAQKKFAEELVKSRGCPFHSYCYRSVLHHRDGHDIKTEHTILIIRTDGDNDCLVVAVVHPCCAKPLLDEVAHLWPRLSEASARLVLRIVESLAHFAV